MYQNDSMYLRSKEKDMWSGSWDKGENGKRSHEEKVEGEREREREREL
jgi:hypothetical protein